MLCRSFSEVTVFRFAQWVNHASTRHALKSVMLDFVNMWHSEYLRDTSKEYCVDCAVVLLARFHALGLVDEMHTLQLEYDVVRVVIEKRVDGGLRGEMTQELADVLLRMMRS